MLSVVAQPSLLELVAQPIVDLATGRAAGYELLSRVPAAWCVPPDVLFHMARGLGVSAALHARVMTEALRLREHLPPDTFATVNVDPIDLPDPTVLDLLLSADSLARLVVEVTEHAWPDDSTLVDGALAQIREHGAMIAADDVGAGYAGLNQLMRIRPDFVKIDKELVGTLGHDPASEALITAVGHLCGSLDAWVIVEGVETEIQLATLTRLGVPLGQGWLLGRPATPWPEVAGADILAHRQSLAVQEDVIASLLRPVSHVYSRDRHGQYWRSDESAPCLVVAPSTPLKDAVKRALSRPPQWRWTPILVTDGAGAVTGEIFLEDLVSAIIA